MKQLIINPKGWPCKLSDCPPGHFLYRDYLCFKSEYKTKNSEGFYQTDAYNDGGEYFWAGAKSSEDRENIIVQPVIAEWVEVEQ